MGPGKRSLLPFSKYSFMSHSSGIFSMERTFSFSIFQVPHLSSMDNLYRCCPTGVSLCRLCPHSEKGKVYSILLAFRILLFTNTRSSGSWLAGTPGKTILPALCLAVNLIDRDLKNQSQKFLLEVTSSIAS